MGLPGCMLSIFLIIAQTTALSVTRTPKIRVTTTAQNCPMMKCSPDCLPGIGPDGCPSCECPPTVTCQGVRCLDGYECQVVNVACDVPPCFPLRRCLPINTTTAAPQRCETKNCSSPCVLDDFAGPCPECACPPTCNNTNCSVGYECQLIEYVCIRAPCFPQPECVPMKFTTATTKRCGTVNCTTPCVLDYLPGRCPECACPPTCNETVCPSGSECQLVKVTCVRAPCFPQPECIPINHTTTEAKRCETVNCTSPCVLNYLPGRCPECACPPTCNGTVCPSGSECQLVEVTCVRAPCFPQPECVPTTQQHLVTFTAPSGSRSTKRTET